jgi:hypothetical protein
MDRQIVRPAADTTSAFRQAFLNSSDITHLNPIESLSSYFGAGNASAVCDSASLKAGVSSKLGTYIEPSGGIQEVRMQLIRWSAARASADAISGILNCVCPECGGRMGGCGKEFKCQGECQTDWRQIWERVLSARPDRVWAVPKSHHYFGIPQTMESL